MAPPGEGRDGPSDPNGQVSDRRHPRLEIPARADLHREGKWPAGGYEVGKIAMGKDFGSPWGRLPDRAGTPALGQG